MKWTISRQKDFRRLLWHLELLFFHPYGQYWHLLSECVGSVALICAGLYVANGNQSKDAFKIATGLLDGRHMGSDSNLDYGNLILESKCRIIHNTVYNGRSGSYHRRNVGEIHIYPSMALRMGNWTYHHGTS